MALIADTYSPVTITSVDSVPTPIAQRFPVSPSSWGICEIVESAWEVDGPVAFINGAVPPESLYLEPALGQIWPRIG